MEVIMNNRYLLNILVFSSLFIFACADDTSDTEVASQGDTTQSADVLPEQDVLTSDEDSGEAPESNDVNVDTTNEDTTETEGEDTENESDTQEQSDAEGEPDTEDESDTQEGGGEGGGDEANVIDCNNPPVSLNSCDAVSGSDILVLHGTVLGPDTTYIGGEVVIANGEIKCVGCDCGDSQGVDGATRITCSNGVISPGLINAHDHITFTQYPPVPHGDERYDHRHEWRKGLNGKTKLSVTQNFYNKGETWGELRLLISGATSVLGSGGEEGFLRNLDKDYLLEGLGKPAAEYDTFPLGDSSGKLSDSGCGAYNIDFGFDIEKEFAYCPHVAEGINAYALNEFLCLSGLANGGIDVVAPNSAFIHGIGITATEVALMAGEGTGLIWSPRSNISLYGHTASVTLYDLLGSGIALGTDWTASGSMNMLREIQCADELNSNHYNGYFSDAELWNMATYNGALLLGYGDILGAIEPDFAADVTIFQGSEEDAHRAVIDAAVTDVLLVMRGGTPLYGRSSLMEQLPEVTDNGCETIDVCGENQQICINRETGETLASLENGVSGGTFETYPLFFCGTPDNEPSCVPFRTGEFDGQITSDDNDGDGVLNEVDNCPNIFNALRPIDLGVQPDKDEDGVGDVCDPCPFDADSEACTSVDPDDLDNDGTPNSQDNCVNLSNEDQLDGDQDGKGDVCDKCPDYPNPGNQGCLASIYDVASGKIEENETVFVENLVVTAVGGNGFYVQLNPAAPNFEGKEFSGIWVYNGGADTQPAVGTQMSMDASYQLYFGEPELTNPVISVTGEGIDIEPELVTPADVATSGALSAAYTGVLIVVKDVVVDSITPDPAGQSTPTNEFSLVGGLLVDDYFYKVAPFPKEGDTITSITGVLKYSWNNTKLIPRSVDDVTLGPPALDSVSPEMAFITAGVIGLSNPPLEVALNQEVDASTFVEVVSGNPGALTVEGGGVTIAPGEKTALVSFNAIEASDEPIVVTAIYDGAEISASVTVLAEDAIPELVSITPSSSSATPGGVITFTVAFSTPTPAGGLELTWTAVSSGDGEDGSNEPPETTGTVTADGNVFETSFTVVMPENPTDVVVSVQLGDSSLETTVTVTTLINAGLIIGEVYYDEPGDDNGKEWVKLYNASGDTIDLSGYSLAWGGTSWSYGVLALEGTIDPWSCYVIGGPSATADNGNPVFDLPVNIEPDIQNGGSTADGVALFALQPFEISDSSIPTDAVLYGSENGSGLLGPGGTAAAVHVSDPPSGSSLQRVSISSWQTSSNPSPTTCPALIPDVENP